MKFYSTYQFIKKKQHVRFRNKIFTTRQVLFWKVNNASDFELKIVEISDFKKLFAIKKSRFGSFYSMKTTYFAFFVLFEKAWFWIENFITCHIPNWKT